MRPIPNLQLAYSGWLEDVERRINEVNYQTATSKWSNFMAWYSLLLLHMPCARNPHPAETSVLKYFDAAVRMLDGYWQLTDSTMLDKPWHATHPCYEAGMLILYSFWHFRDLLRRNYNANHVFDVVHRVSGCFVRNSIWIWREE